MHRCARCGFDAPVDFAFCPRCGSKLESACPGCGQACPPDFQFCARCGTRLGEAVPSADAPSTAGVPADPEDERRLVTILFADVSGFTAMSEKLDHEEVNEVMRACWSELDAIVIARGGHVDKHIGDALMATFGARHAHEDDPLRAVQAALTLQEALTDFSARLEARTGHALRMRCGLALGEVTVGRVADSTGEQSVIGPAVNLASRLEHEAEVGTVLVDDEVHRATAWAIEYQELGAQQIRGIERPIPLYRPLREREAGERLPEREAWATATGVVGRDAEQGALYEALDDVLAGRGRVVALLGDAGMGKSTLAAALRQIAEAGGIRWVGARCLSYSAHQPYALVRDLLRELLGVGGRAAPEVVRDRLDLLLLATPLDEDAGGAQLTVEDRRSLLAALLLGERAGGAAAFAEALDPKTRRRLTEQAVRELLVAQAARRPLVLSLEDLHWCDPESLEVAGGVAAAAAEQRLLVLVQARPEAEPAWMGLPHARALRLGPLGGQDTRRLLAAALGERARAAGAAAGGGLTDALAGLADRLEAAAEGNPYFLVEIVRSLIEEGRLLLEEGGWRLADPAGGGVEALELPSTVRRLLTARIDTLRSEPRRVLQESAVVGQTFDAPTVHAISDQPADVGPSLDVLTERAFVEEVGLPVEAEAPARYEYRHGLMREAAYETMARRRRQVYHGRVGEVLESRLDRRDPSAIDLLAHHFTLSDRDQPAVHYALLAAERAAAQFASEGALHWFARADEALGRIERAGEQAPVSGPEPIPRAVVLEQRVRLLEGRAAVNQLLGRFGAAQEELNAAMALCRAAVAVDGHWARPRMPELCRRLARAHEAPGEYAEAMRWVEHGLELAGAAWEEGAAELRAAAAPAASPTARLCLVAGLINMRWGRYAEAAVWARRAEALAGAARAERAADRDLAQDLAQTCNLLAALARLRGEPAQARRFAEEAVSRYEALGDPVGAERAHDILANALQDQGELPAAIEQYRRSRELARRVGDPVRQASVRTNMSEAYLLLGDLDEARRGHEEAALTFERHGHVNGASIARMNLANVLLTQGDGAGALALVTAAQDGFAIIGATTHEPEALRYRALALLRLGQHDAARAAAERATARARELGRRIEEGQALRVLGQVLGARSGDRSAGLSAMEESAAVLEGTSARYELGLTLLERARALADASTGDELGRARALGLVEQAGELFRAAGAVGQATAAAALRRRIEGTDAAVAH